MGLNGGESTGRSTEIPEVAEPVVTTPGKVPPEDGNCSEVPQARGERHGCVPFSMPRSDERNGEAQPLEFSAEGPPTTRGYGVEEGGTYGVPPTTVWVDGIGKRNRERQRACSEQAREPLSIRSKKV